MIRETTPALYAIKLLEVMESLGFPYQELTREHGLTAGDLAATDREIPLDKYLATVEGCVARAGLDDLGFRVGEHTGLLEHGALGYALISSQTLEESLHRYVRYQAVVGPLLAVTLERDDKTAVMKATPLAMAAKLPLAVQHYFLQEWLATWNPWCRLIEQPGNFFTGVNIGLSAPAPAARYTQHLGCPITFEPGPTLGRFPADYLGLSLRFSDASTGAFCHEQCELLLRAIEAKHGLTAEVHRQLARTPGRVPGMEDVANKLGMTARTLRRHLLAEDAIFQDLVIEHRMGMARRYLEETALPTEEIAGLVGYADAANFFRMFHRTEGITPARFRDHASRNQRC